MPKGLSIREFARRDGCSEKLVRRKIQSGHLAALEDGSLAPELVGTAWRKSSAAGADNADSPHPAAASKGAAKTRAEKTPHGDDIENVIRIEDRTFFSKAVAERIKENNLALLRQLEYDRESGAVAEIEDVGTAVVAEYMLVRNKLMSIGSRVAPRAAVMRSPEEVKALIDSEVALALEELTLDGGGSSSPDELRRALQERFGKAS